MRTLAIVGAGGHARLIADTAEVCDRWSKIVFFDDMCDENGQTLIRREGWHFRGQVSRFFEECDAFSGVIVGIGNNGTRLAVHRLFASRGARMVSIVHPSAIISGRAFIGAGSLISAGAVINMAASIGEACIINTSATVDHDCAIGHGSHISPGANLSGSVSVGEECWVGAGACFKQLVSVGAGCTIGAGSVVVRDVPAGRTAYGNPARVVPDTVSAELV